MAPGDPWLRVAPSRTPLADVAAAEPLLRALGGLLSRNHLEVKVGAVLALAPHGAGPWRFEQLVDILHWVKPELVADLLKLLRQDGVLAVGGRRHRLTPEGRTVAAFVDFLSQARDPRHVIRELDALIAYALARGDPESVALRRFQIAVSYLEDAAAELRELLDRGSLEDLQQAVDRAEAYREDMRALTERHAVFLHQHAFDAAVRLDALAASDAVPSVALLLYQANQEIARRVRELRQSGVRIDRDTVRSWLTRTDLAVVAGAVGDHARPVPAPPHVDVDATAETLRERLRQARRPVQVPPPTRRLPTRAPPPRPPTAAERAWARITALDEEGASMAELVLGETWADAVGAQVGVLQLLAEAAARADFVSGTSVEPRRAEVHRLPDATVRPMEER